MKGFPVEPVEGVGRGSGSARSAPGQVPKWPGEQPQGSPYQRGVGEWCPGQVRLPSWPQFPPLKNGRSESASRDVGRRTEDRPRGGGDWLALLGFAGPEPAPTPPRPSCTAVLCPRSPQTHPTSCGGGFRPDNSLSLTFSTSPFRKKETAKMLRAETLTGSSKAPPGGC